MGSCIQTEADVEKLANLAVIINSLFSKYANFYIITMAFSKYANFLIAWTVISFLCPFITTRTTFVLRVSQPS